MTPVTLSPTDNYVTLNVIDKRKILALYARMTSVLQAAYNELALANSRLREENAKLRGALEDLLETDEEYVRINNLHNADGTPATNHAMRRARAALIP